MLKSDDGKKTTEFSVSVSSTAKAESKASTRRVTTTGEEHQLGKQARLLLLQRWERKRL